ncbi:hypothetical protein SLEP1_g15233 [Rubroshorea leprosula]|uniref:Uncharacterized protein n=1 Tax=Rubroshorea leprosula TaxID=152421 RepID=A0AAV5ISN9_9ROSI|nr:hypothetical protein SLEP1_g15233 [Rubroshorea leprosula]
MAAQISQPDLPGRAPKLQVKRKFVAPADSTEEDTPSKQRRTGGKSTLACNFVTCFLLTLTLFFFFLGIKRPAVKPAAAKKLIKSASPSESTSAMETQIPPNKTEDVSPKLDQVEENIAASDEGDSATIPTKSGNGSSPATKSVAVDVPMIDDDLENELLAQLDMLMDAPAKSGSATDSKGKAVAEEVEFDTNLPTQEQISFAIMTLQELLGGDPSHFCKVPDQPAAFEAAQILSRAPQLSSSQQKFWADFTSIYTHFSRKFRVLESKVAAADSVRKSVADSTAAVLKKKEEFLAAKEAHVTQVTHVQGLKEKNL